jgi:hypothetical protein
MHNLVAETLISIFKITISQLTAQMAVEKQVMSILDMENADCVLLMASLNLFNTEKIMEEGDEYYANNKEKVDRFFNSASGFADSLLAEGYGINPTQS